MNFERKKETKHTSKREALRKWTNELKLPIANVNDTKLIVWFRQTITHSTTHFKQKTREKQRYHSQSRVQQTQIQLLNETNKKINIIIIFLSAF